MEWKKYDLYRLKKCMRRALAGEELTIGFLGGSITQGSLASKPEYTYAYRVFSWWKETFPQAKFYYVNGGIGGTSSHYGVSRAVTDVLMYQPDFVCVDFSVNDLDYDFCQETYEGVVRRLLSWPSRPAVVLLNNIYYDTGNTAEDAHVAVGDRYGVPHVSIRDTIYREMKEGKYAREELTPDGLHPNDKGHGLLAAEIVKRLEKVKKEVERDIAADIRKESSSVLPDERAETDVCCGGENTEAVGCVSPDDGIKTKDGSFACADSPDGTLPAPLTANAYENARRLTIRELCPKLDGFRADTEEKTGLLDHFKNGWIGKHPGDRLAAELTGTCIAVQYRRTIQRPARRARLVLDGRQDEPFLLDGNFDEDWGDCLYLTTVLHHGEPGKHTVEIEILPDENDTATPFYLMAFIVA